ncbi:hypothetical protein D3C76_753830 [compost metagenome]
MVAQVIGPAIDVPAHSAPGQRLEVIHHQRRGLFIHSHIGDGQRHRVIRTTGQRCGNRWRRLVGCRVKRQIIGLHRFAMGEGSGFIQRQVVELVAPFQIHTTLDQDAFARGGGEAADDGHRGGNHQCTGACDHQQHQCAINPVKPQRAHEQRRNHRHREGENEHGRRVDSRKLVNESLGRCARALSLFDGVDDPRQRRMVRFSGHHIFQGAGLIDGAGEHLVANRFIHRQAFTGDRRLIDGRTARHHFTVQTDTFARTHPHPRAELDGFDILSNPAAIGLQHRGLLRGHLHQAADGVARPVQGFGLDQLGHGEQEHHHRRFRPLPDEDRAGHGDTHQCVDVQVEVLKRDPAFFIGTEAAAEDRDQRNDRYHPVRRSVGEMDHFRGQCANT